jgi:hypothetical protein
MLPITILDSLNSKGFLMWMIWNLLLPHLYASYTSQSSSKCIKSLCMNHPCALCNTYGHYSHHYPKLPQFLMPLTLFSSWIPLLQHQTPIVEDLTLMRERFFQDNSKPIIEIGPPKVKMMRIPCKLSTFQLPWDRNYQKMLHFLLMYIKSSLVCLMYICLNIGGAFIH